MTARRPLSILVLLLWLGVCAPTGFGAQHDAQEHTLVEYTVSLPSPQTQTVEMSMTLRGIEAEIVEVALPVWRPGRYEVLDPAGTISQVRARSGRGRELAIEKVEKSVWVIQTDIASHDDVVTVEYRVYANSLGNRTRHVDDTHAFLSPSTVFMFAPAMRDAPVRVRIEAPADWRTATGLEPDPASPGVWLAPNYDVLVDSPFEIGLHEIMSFDVDGVPHEIAIWAPGPQPRIDADQMKRDFAAIVRTQREIFGNLPYTRYVFLIHCYPGGRGGTEHLNSTIMQVTPQAFRTPETYRRFLKLVSHEMFHTWNVKQFRPAGLLPYDYHGENYTHLLWVAEGTTSYYDWLTLVRAGIVRPDDYLRTLSDSIHSLMNRPGSQVQSLEESSLDAWIKFNRPTPDSANTTISFYDKGALVSLLLDMEMRSRTENRVSLDDLMRMLYRSFPLDSSGYTTADVFRLVEHLTESDFRAFFRDFVAGTRPLEFDALKTTGLEVAPPSVDRQRAYLGFTVEARDNLAAVTSVLADGPAHAAGLQSDDLIVAINGVRLRPGELDSRTRELQVGEAVSLTTIRHEMLREVTFAAGARPEGRWTIRRIRNPDAAQRAAYESWLGQPWPGAAPEREAGRRPTEPREGEPAGPRRMDDAAAAEYP